MQQFKISIDLSARERYETAPSGVSYFTKEL